MYYGAKRVGKHGAKRRLTISTDRQLAQGEEFVGQVPETFQPPQLTLLHLSKSAVKFLG
jgi:hypothetical protein